VEEFTKLTETLGTRFGQETPSLGDLQAVIAMAHGVTKKVLASKAPDPEAAFEEDGEGGGSSGGGLGSRAEIYRRVQEAADALERLEPHSPTPYLLRRAVGLGAMSFPQLIRALLADGATLDSITKEFGIQESQESANP
jgi:type VI secretion system protein ImpA